MWSSVDASNVDYAIGIEPNTKWFSVPSATQGFIWYVGITGIAIISGSGVFYIGSSSDFGNGKVNITANSGKFCDFSRQIHKACKRESAQ